MDQSQLIRVSKVFTWIEKHKENVKHIATGKHIHNLCGYYISVNVAVSQKFID